MTPRRPPRRAWAPAAVVLCLAAGAGRAHADQRAAGGRWWFEGHFGRDAPLGAFGSSLVRDWEAGRWQVGAGVGGSPEGRAHLALFGRVRLLRLGPVSLPAVIAASVGERRRELAWRRAPQYEPERLRWDWSPGYRLDLALAPEWTRGSWKLRLEGGVGLLTRPECEYVQTFDLPVRCGNPDVPPEAQVDPPRLAPYVVLGVGVSTEPAGDPTADFGGAGPARGAMDDAHGDRAYLTPSALAHVPGTITATAYPLLAAVTYALTTRLELGAVVAGFPEANWRAMGGGVRVRIGAIRGLHVAGVAAAFTIQNDARQRALGAAGAVTTWCIGDECRSQLSATAVAIASRGRLGALVSPAAVLNLARRLKLVGELHWAAGEAPVVLALLRIPFSAVAFSAGLAFVEISTDTGRRHIPLPTGAIGVRW